MIRTNDDEQEGVEYLPSPSVRILTQISDHIFSGVIYCVDNSVDCGSRIHVREAKPCATLSRLLTDPDSVPHKASSASCFCGLSSVSKRLY